jgi:capsular exopolysaccharide synthesis family protein
VEPVRSSSIVRVNFDSADPGVAAKVVNAAAEGFININLERRYGASSYARDFLQDRLQQLKQKLEESERGLVAYAEQQALVDAGDKQTLAQSNLAAANNDYGAATTERLRAELLWQQVQSADALSLPQVLENKSIETLRAKRTDLGAEYQDKLGLFKPAYPEMRQLQSQIDELDRQIEAEIDLIKDSIKAQYDAALAEEHSLAAQIEKLKADVTDFRNRNIQYTILQREVDTNRQLYDGLLQRYKEIGVAGGVGANNIAVVDKAGLPDKRFKPSLPRNLAISLMLGLLFGSGAAFAREQLDDTFKSPEDLEESLGLPLLGMIPLAHDRDEHNRLLQEPRSSFAEAYRSLRTALQFSTTSGVPKSLLITSSRPSEGKSSTAATLARNFAELGMRVLLIDADLRKPSLHTALGLGNGFGLTNCLIDNAIPPDVFQKTAVSGLTFMASGPLPPNPAELLAGPKMLSLLTVAAEKYDIVIVDSPPVGGLADAPLLANMVIGTLLVVDVSATHRGVARAAVKRLHFARAQMVGTVVNKVDVSHQGYGYAYGYGYSYGYGDAAYYGEESTTPAVSRPQPRLKSLLSRMGLQ